MKSLIAKDQNKTKKKTLKTVGVLSEGRCCLTINK